MRLNDGRITLVIVMLALALPAFAMTGTAASGNTLDITGITIDPNPGYACENSTISFNVTNNLGQTVDLITVSVALKGAAGGMSWQSNISLLADGASSFQSFVWAEPPVGTYDVSITVIGAGQISQKSGIYTVLPCAAHVYIGSVTIVKSAQAPGESATVTVDVLNDGHAPAYNTTVAVQATGPSPEKTRYFIGSIVLPVITASGGSHPEIIWAPIPAPGVYTVTVIAIDGTGVPMSKEVSLVVDLQPRPNTVRITGITVDPWPPMQGQEGNVTADLLFHGNWTGVPVTVKAYADGPASYLLLNITLKEVMVESLVMVNFSWPATIEPGEYNLTVTASMFNPKEYTISKVAVTQMSKQKAWLPSNFRLELKGLRISPYPPLPGQNATVTVEVQNTGDTDAPPAKLTVTAEGPAFYNLGTRTTPSTSFGTMVRMEFNWTQPIMPGDYTISAFLEDAGGNQSELRKTFPMPHILESNLSIVNGTNVYNYYYYGAAPNGSQGQNITVVVPATLNETEAAATGLNNPTTGAIVGVAIGSVVSIASMAAYGLAKRRGQMTDVQSNPMYKDNATAGQNPMYQDKGMAGENPLYIHERMVHGIHNGPDNNPPKMAISEQGTPKKPPKGKEAFADGGVTHEDTWETRNLSHRVSPTMASDGRTSGGAAPGESTDGSTSQWPSTVRESPTLPSKGQTAVRESPTKASLGQTAVRESPSKASDGPTSMRESPTRASPGSDVAGAGEQAPVGGALPGGAVISSAVSSGTRESPTRATTVTDADGDASSDARMAINEKGLPGKKKPSTQRLAGDGTEPIDDDSDDDGVPEIQGMAINEKGLPGDKKKKTNSQARTAGYGEPLDPDDDGDGTSDAVSKKGYDYYQAKSDMAAGRATRASAAGATNDNVSSIAQTAGSSPGVPESNLGRKGWDGTIKGVTSDESAAGREAAHPVISQVRESPTRASGLRESPTLPSADQTELRESPTRASGLRESPTLPPAGQTAVRESPTKASLGQTAVRESPTKASGLRESPTLPSRDQATGQSSGTRSGMGGETAPEAPAGRSDYAIKEQGVKMMNDDGGRHTPFHNKAQEAQDHNSSRSNKTSSIAQDISGGGETTDTPSRAQDYNSSRSNKTASSAAPDGGEGTGSGGTGPDGEHSATDKDGKKNYVGHVTLIKQ